MARIINGYLIKEEGFNLFDLDPEKYKAQQQKPERIGNEIAIMFTENDAKEMIRLKVESIDADPLKYTRKCILNGEGVAYTSDDDRLNGIVYRIYYDKQEVILP